MTASRVGDLHVQLRLPARLADEAARIRAQVEQRLVVGVLEELERRLHAALGGDATVYVRHVELHWRVGADALDDAGERGRLAAALVHDLLEELTAQPEAERLRPRARGVVAFADRPHAAAAWIADRVDGVAPAWFHAARGDAEATWREVVAEGGEVLAAVVRWLARMDRRAEALAIAPDDVLIAVAALEPVLAGEVAVVRARRAVSAHGYEVSARGAEASGARADAPSLAPAVSSPSSPASEAAIAAGSRAREIAVAALTAGDAQGRALAAPVDRIAPRPPSSVPARSPTTDPGPTVGPAPDAIAAAPDDPMAPDVGEVGDTVDTAYAGLFYLIGRVLEIELAEQLWAAGVPEGAVLAQVARAIIACDDDPAWRWFGGDAERAPELAAWAADEVAAAVQHALGRRLVRFAVTTTPDELAATLDRLAATVAVPLGLAPVLAGLVRRCVAALAVIVGARLGEPASLAQLADLVRRPGRLVRTADELRVILPAAAFAMAHRRAGLDQDPGRAPWLGRRVVIELVGGETL